jgi:hypothetical protein
MSDYGMSSNNVPVRWIRKFVECLGDSVAAMSSSSRVLSAAGTPPLQKRVTKALKESVLAGVQKLDEKCQPVLKEGI